MDESRTCELCDFTLDSNEELQGHWSLERGTENQAGPRFIPDDKEGAA